LNGLFLLKLILSFALGAVWVVAATVLAEKLGPKTGGLIAGLPLTVTLGLFFLACADRFPVHRAGLDFASGPEYPRGRGQDGGSSRFRTRPAPRTEKEFLILKGGCRWCLLIGTKKKDF